MLVDDSELISLHETAYFGYMSLLKSANKMSIVHVILIIRFGLEVVGDNQSCVRILLRKS